MIWLLTAYFSWNYGRALTLLHAADDPWTLGDDDHPNNTPLYIGIWFVILLLLFGAAIDALRLVGWTFEQATAKEPQG